MGLHCNQAVLILQGVEGLQPETLSPLFLAPRRPPDSPPNPKPNPAVQTQGSKRGAAVPHGGQVDLFERGVKCAKKNATSNDAATPACAPRGGRNRTWGRGCLRLLLPTRTALSTPHSARDCFAQCPFPAVMPPLTMKPGCHRHHPCGEGEACHHPWAWTSSWDAAPTGCCKWLREGTHRHREKVQQKPTPPWVRFPID